MERYGEYIRVNGNYNRVSSYRHWTERTSIIAHDKAAPDGKIYVVKCPDCGSSDFSDDGRYCNEFNCTSCVESYVEVYFHKGY